MNNCISFIFLFCLSFFTRHLTRSPTKFPPKYNNKAVIKKQSHSRPGEDVVQKMGIIDQTLMRHVIRFVLEERMVSTGPLQWIGMAPTDRQPLNKSMK